MKAFVSSSEFVGEYDLFKIDLVSKRLQVYAYGDDDDE